MKSIVDIYNFEQGEILKTRSRLFNNQNAKNELVNMLEYQSKNKTGLSSAKDGTVKQLEQKIIEIQQSHF